MEAALYDAALADILAQRLDWAGGGFRVALVQKGYKFSPAHTSFADIAAHVNGVSDALPGCKIDGKQALAGDTYLLALRGAYSDQVVVYRHAPKAADMRLVCWSSTPAVQPVPGQRVDIPWPDSLVFAL